MLHAKGFTLLEMVMAMTVLIIIIGFGMPALAGLIDRQRMTTAMDSLLRSLAMAREEAIRQNRPVTMAPIGDNWNTGWTLFIDANRNGRHDHGGILLQHVEPPVTSGIHGNVPVREYVQFNAMGETQLLNGGFQAGNFTFCPQRNDQPARRLIINSVGRWRTDIAGLNEPVCQQ